MVLKLVLPYIDRLVDRGSILRWHKQEGDWVDYGDALLDFGAPIRGLLVVRLTASDRGHLRRVCAPVGSHHWVGALLAVLTTGQDEPMDDAGPSLAAASAFRVVTEFVSPGGAS